VYLTKELSDTSSGGSLNATVHGAEGGGGDNSARAMRSNSGSGGGASSRGSMGGGRRSIGNDTGAAPKREMVLKVTSILSRQQRDIAEKEAKLLSRLSHPSIIKMYDTCYRTAPADKKRGKGKDQKERPQHLILMEYCEGGHALDVCANLVANGERFDLSTLIIAFGQICNAVSYLHAQRPPIVHRDLKPANFLVKNGAYKLCDFGSAVFGHVDLKTPQARAEAEEVIEKTTTQMFRAPEMVDLYMAKKLTQATDVWALGCCLYSLAFLQNCFEEGSNLAILSRKFKIPDDNPYGDGIVELIDRMLTIDSKERADMTEVILCLSAVYSGRPLPPKKEKSKKKEKDKEKKEKKSSSSSSSKDKDGVKEGSDHKKDRKKKNEQAGTYRTTGQGIYDEDLALDPNVVAQKEAKKLDPNSAAARRRAAAEKSMVAESFHSKFEEPSKVNQEAAFSTENPFASFEGKSENGSGSKDDVFGSFEDSAVDTSDDVVDAFSKDQEWGESDEGGTFNDFAAFSPETGKTEMTRGNADEDDDEGDNGEENGGRRRRRTSLRRNSGKGKSQEEESGESKEDSEARRNRAVRRTRSGSRHRPARGNSKDLSDMADTSKEDKEGDEGSASARRRTKGRRSSAGGEARTPSGHSRRTVGRSDSGKIRSRGSSDKSDE